MARIASIVFLLVLVNVSLASDKEEVNSYLSGFLKGLQADPSVSSKCTSDLSVIAQGSSQIVNDIQGVMNNVPGAFTNLVSDTQDLFQQHTETIADCNLGQLAQALSTLMGPNGYSMVMNNYFKNILAVSKAVEGLKTCGTNYEACGEYSGEILKYLLNYSIQSSLSVQPLTTSISDYISFTEGFIHGAQVDPDDDSQCLIDFESLSVNFETLQDDVDEILSGNVIKGFYQLSVDINKLLESSVPNLAYDCNVEGLFNALSIMFQPGGGFELMSNYQKNKAQVDADFATIHECSEDYYECGKAFSNSIQLVTGWTISD